MHCIYLGPGTGRPPFFFLVAWFCIIPLPGAGTFDTSGVIVAAPFPRLGTAPPRRVLSVSSG